MPIPFLAAGALVAGVLGAGGHASARQTNEKAQRRAADAQQLYDDAKLSLEQAQKKTEKSLLKLGYAKKNVLDSSMRQFLSAYDKVKHIQVTESVGTNEISKFTIDQQGAIEIQHMTDIYSSSIKSGATGAAAGAVVALAASGSLSVVTGGLATAGTAFAAGEMGMAAGIAGSALSFGAAMTPLAAVAAPVLLFTGISASMKADENMEKANTMYAEAREAAEKMKTSEVLCDAISERSEMFDDLLAELNQMFAECSSLLSGVVRKKEGRFFKKKLTSTDFTEDDLKLLAVTRSLAGAVKSVIDTPILSKDGNISYESEDIYEQTVEKLPDFSQAVQEVEQIDFDVTPVQSSVVGNSGSDAARGATVLDGTRNVFAFVLGIILATLYAERFAVSISDGYSKFLFLSAFTANKIAIWLLIAANVIIVLGKYKGTKMEKWCGIGSGVSLFVLYAQYCRTLEQMSHYIILSVIVFIVGVILWFVFDEKKEKYQGGVFLSMECLCIAIMPLLFLVYAFFSKLLGFPEGFFLAVTSIVMFLASMFGMTIMIEDN
jgi:hypothetical protein